MRGDACLNCKFSGGERVQFRGEQWTSCRVDGPQISSTAIGNRSDAWAGQWPWRPVGDWCGRHSFDKAKAAAKIELGDAQPA